jgi:hypothetical protein
MRPNRSIPFAALTVGLLLLAGCYVEETSSGTVQTTETDDAPSAPTGGAATDRGGQPASSSTLGKARDSARRTVDQLEARSAETARTLDDPDAGGDDEPQ